MGYRRASGSAQGSPQGASSRYGAAGRAGRSVEEAAAAAAAAYGVSDPAAAAGGGRGRASRAAGGPSRPLKAQQAAPQALSVSAAMQLAKGALENVTVRLVGEVSELSNKPGYKAVYFTVKDKSAALPCMMWNNRFRASGVQMSVGQLVELTGRFTLYAAKGRMNFDVFSISPVGEGSLRLQVANLARKLEAEGLMDPARKLAIPAYPASIGVVTSPRGDAVHDVLRTLRRRFPVARVLFAGVAVEGPQAAAGIVEGMRCVVHAGAEVVLVVRGGGSYEDLMPFNDEFLARMIVKCPVPVVTGIGHEPDTSIADMVADVRASTPTAAAEKVSPARESLQALFAARGTSLAGCVERGLERASAQVERAASRPVFSDANALLAPWAQGLDIAAQRLPRALPVALDRDRAQVDRLRERLAAALPSAVSADAAAVERQRERLARVMPQAVVAYGSRVERDRERLALALPAATSRHEAQVQRQQQRLLSVGDGLTSRFAQQAGVAAAKLDALSPVAVLARGWSIARDEAGHVVKSVAEVAPESRLSVTVSDGVIGCRVESTHPDGA